MQEPDGLWAIIEVVKDFYETGIDDHFFVFILLVLVVADVVTGFCKAWALKNFSSRKARTGIVTHSAIFIITAIGYPFFLFANAGALADMIITALCASYGASLVTNLDILGLKIPYITTFINERVDNHKTKE
jgi:toxin secretion/phage lysis holin|nr:MAG TPA: holin [Bacteriophage sp.]DAV69780.1 MAG TPA: holin [Caudoviricetes sp.]